jgi:hypothetical protein
MSAWRWLVKRAFRLPVVAALILVLGPAVASHATSPAPATITASVSSNINFSCKNCADPGLLIVQGTPFTLTVNLQDSLGNPTSFNTNTALNVTANGPGSITPASVTMPAKQSSATFPISYSTYADNVTLTVSPASKKSGTITPGTATFDVLQAAHVSPGNPGFADGTGPDNCADVTAANPICGFVKLPNGANSDVLLTTGACGTVANCDSAHNGTLSQVVADLGDPNNGGLYSPTNPATLILKCYRTICGQGGVNKHYAYISLGASGDLAQSPPCPAKGTIGAGENFCTDYVQSSRDNADDLLLYVLFDEDLRASGG